MQVWGFEVLQLGKRCGLSREKQELPMNGYVEKMNRPVQPLHSVKADFNLTERIFTAHANIRRLTEH